MKSTLKDNGYQLGQLSIRRRLFNPLAASTNFHDEPKIQEEIYLADKVWIKLQKDVQVSEFFDHLNAKGGILKKTVIEDSIYEVSFDKIPLIDHVEYSLDILDEYFKDYIIYAEPIPTMWFGSAPSDPSFSTQWFHQNTGQNGGTSGADISSTDAWDTRYSASGTIVAILDSGTLLTHDELDDNLWTNPGETPGNSIDDDSNGYIDDIHGFDTENEDGDPTGPFYHGTAVAGCVGAEANNSLGGCGVAWDVHLMCIRVGEYFPVAAGVVRGLAYARQEDADIINLSLYMASTSQTILDEIQEAKDEGIIIVTIAGNDNGRNLDTNPVYPACYNEDNIVVLAATDRDDELCTFSNIGSTSVDLAAPGEEILMPSNDSDQSFVDYTSDDAEGTSFAAPLAAGALALMKEEFSNHTYFDSIGRLLLTTEELPSLDGVCFTEGRLNLDSALDSWIEIPWMGWIEETYYPWIYHIDHGWLWTADIYKSTCWIYDPANEIGWFSTTSASYPTIFSNVTNSWLLYLVDSTNPRWFYNYSTSQWFSVYGDHNSTPPQAP